jgi:soluble lytic murein transglycosylase-like protein
MSIKIPVQADLNTASVEQQLAAFQQKLNALGQQIAMANKAQFNPIGPTTLQDLRRVTQQFEALRRVSGDLNRRINSTGQKGRGFVDLDWSQLYPDAHSRARQQAKAFQYVTGHAMGSPGAQPGQTQPGHQPSGPSSWQQAGAGVVQSGLRAASGATGGVGGVAAGALGTGMAGGTGAGLMGLMGGVLALGVGKIVSAATEKIDQAEDNAVAYDRLKRVLGDTSVAFNSLKGVIGDAGRNTSLTFSEVTKLGTEYARLGNLSGDQYKGLFGRGGELETGVGLSRSFGLDPSQGVGVLGSMRGVGVTRNEQDTRRFALLLAEAIGKSGAFSKAGEVMDALANYATSQTRNSMGAANVSGFGGMFSGLVGSGIPGLDPAGAGGLLNRINSSLAAGGAKGEASQFFTARLGAARGMDVFDTQLWREGGAFSTANGTFGGDGAVARFYEKYGLAKPKGSETLLSANLGQLKRDYVDPKMMLMATANHLGINMSQAAALHVVDPNQMGGMQKYADLTKLSGSGIGNLSKALYGSAADRTDLAGSLARRKGADALSAEELSRLNHAMKEGSADEQKRVLAELVATRDQERTQGSDIRDSKNALDNIKTSIADKLIPLTQEMRAGIIYMAGQNGKLSTEQIMQAVIDNDSNARVRSINGGADIKTQAEMAEKARIEAEQRQLQRDGLLNLRETPEVAAARKAKMAENAKALEEIEQKLEAIQKEKHGLIQKENSRRKSELDSLAKPGPAETRPAGGAGAGAGAGGKSLFDSLLDQESGGRHRNKDGSLVTSKSGAKGVAQLMPGTAANPGYGIRPVADDSEAENRRVGREYLDAMLREFGGDRQKALAAYNAGPGAVRKSVKKHGDNWLQFMPRETQNYVPAVLARTTTPMPSDAVAAGRQADAARQSQADVNVRIDPLEVRHMDPSGREILPRQCLDTRFFRAQPFGAG